MLYKHLFLLSRSSREAGMKLGLATLVQHCPLWASGSKLKQYFPDDKPTDISKTSAILDSETKRSISPACLRQGARLFSHSLPVLSHALPISKEKTISSRPPSSPPALPASCPSVSPPQHTAALRLAQAHTEYPTTTHSWSKPTILSRRT